MEKLRGELKRVCKNSYIKITSGISFNYDEKSKTVHMVMKDGIKENMQDDKAAFEAWALVLKANLEGLVDFITLDWDSQPKLTDEERRHYNRFLYRVAAFSKLYSLWFRVLHKETSWEEQVSRNNWGTLILNSPGNRDVINEIEDFDPASEHNLEIYFTTVGSGKLRQAVKEQFNIQLGEIKNQYPVGLFNHVVSKESYIFTGGKSAIDLYSIADDHSFNIFELKGEENVKVGILSELFFYSLIIRDVMDKKIKNETEDFTRLSIVNAFFLVSRLHPLITDKVIDMLNINERDISYKKLIYEINSIDFSSPTVN